MKTLFFILLFSVNTFAYLNKQLIQKKDGDHYLLSYSENGKFLFDHILVPNGKLQELKVRKIFNSKSELLKFKKFFLQKQFRKNRSIQKNRFAKRVYAVTEKNHKSIWPVKNNWSLEREKDFANWIKEEFDENFFVKYNLSTDCADVAFALRWIFARNNNLPAANTLAGSHIIFSQDSIKKEWDNLPKHKLWHKDQVFLSALKYLMLHAYTGTLNIDGYPIELNRESFLPGTIHLDGGHTMIISQVDYKKELPAPIYKLSSTVPAEVRVLQKEIMINDFITDKENGGLFRMRWPTRKDGKWKLIPKEDMPLYSLEQYTSDFLGDQKSFTLALIERLGIDFAPRKIVDEAIVSIKGSLQDRIGIVQKAYDFCLKNSCEEGSFNYEEHSTPTRDKRIKERFTTLYKLLKSFKSFDKEICDYLDVKMQDTLFEVNNVTKTLSEYMALFQNSLLSYDPKGSISERWALDVSSMTSTINKRFLKRIKSRDLIVKESSFCNKKTCKEGSSNFFKYNTYKLDEELTEKIYTPYNYVKSEFPNIKSLNRDIENIPFYTSTPYSKNRWGNGQKNFDYIYISGKDIIELNEHYIWVDGGILSTKTNKRVPLPKVGLFNYFLEEQRAILTFIKNELLIYNLKGELLIKKTLLRDINEISWLSKNHFTLQFKYPESNILSDNDFFIYELNNLELRIIDELQSTSHVSHDGEDQIQVEVVDESTIQAYYNYSKNELLYVSKDGVYKKKAIDFDSGNINIYRNEIIYTSSDSSLTVEDLNESIACTIKRPKEYVYWYRSSTQKKNILKAQNEDSTKFALYYLENCELKLIKVFNSYINIEESNKLTVISSYEDSRKIYIFNNQNIVQIPLKKDSFLYSLDQKNSIAYIANFEGTKVKSAHSFNLITSAIKKVKNKNLFSYCAPTDILPMLCKNGETTSFKTFYNDNGNIREFYSKVLVNDRVKLNAYFSYSSDQNSDFFTPESQVSLKSYTAIRKAQNKYLLIKD